MAAFKTVEEIQAWQKARALTRLVYDCTKASAFARDFALTDQIRRAAISVMSNIAEGFERGRPAEFVHFLRIAKGSAGEVKTQLYIALDQGYIDQDRFDQAQALADETSRMIAALAAYLVASTTRNPQLATRNPKSGFALPAALFLLVVLSGLAAWMMRISGAALAQSDLELEGERAYQAAQAGLEAGIHAARGGSCAAQTLGFTGALARFTASVACTATTADEGGRGITLYAVTSTACNEPDAGACPNASPGLVEYTERQLSASVESGS